MVPNESHLLKRATLLAAMIFSVAACGAGGDCEGVSARVMGAEGAPRLAVCADVARTENERRKGLLGRESLDPGDGLLIWFPLEGEACITGEGMAFAIEVVFASTEGTVIAVAPFGVDDDRLVCYEGVRSALEVAAGVAKSVRAGDRLVVSPSPE